MPGRQRRDGGSGPAGQNSGPNAGGDNNQRGDNYTLLTVLFAAVLFFAAMAERLRASWARNAMLGLASVLMVVGIVFLASFPKLI